MDDTSDRTQIAFRRMLRAYFATGSWDTPETREYLELEADASFVIAQRELQAVIAGDHVLHYFPEPTCGDCQESYGMMWQRMAGVV